MNEDTFYFARRAAEERRAAMRSSHLKARAAHLEMARLYQGLVEAGGGRLMTNVPDVAGAA